MIAKYVPPTRRLNIAVPMISANRPGTRMMARMVKVRLWKGCQNSGSEVIWFQSMKSGMPGVDWILVFSTLEASSLRNIAMQ
jgi:hypothetical protein